jgi:hypothetical protein
LGYDLRKYKVNNLKEYIKIKTSAQKIETESTNGEMGYNTNFVG